MLTVCTCRECDTVIDLHHRIIGKTIHGNMRYLGEIPDRSFVLARYRASALNLVTAAIVLWNTVYLECLLAQCLRVHQVGRALTGQCRQ